MSDITETFTPREKVEINFIINTAVQALRRAQGALDEKDYDTYRATLASVETMMQNLRMGYLAELVGDWHED